MRAMILLALGVAVATAADHAGHAAPTDGVCSLDVVSDPSTNELHLLVGTRDGETVRLEHLRSGDGGENWTAPTRVDRDDARPAGLRRGADARLIAHERTLTACWCATGTGWGGSGPLACARSHDGGATWEAQATPADDGSTAGHNFVALAHDGRGGQHAVWLDGRGGQQGLIHAARSGDGAWSRNLVVDDATCECCPNALFAAGDELFALYRDRDPRDLVLAAWDPAAATWHRRGAVGAFAWRFDGCPHSGGALATHADALHALVWTGADGHLGVHHLASRDGGRTWTAPTRLSAHGNHPTLAACRSGLVAAWDIAGGIEIATSTDGARWSPPRRIVDGVAAQSPLVVATGTGARVFWSEGAPARWTSQAVTP